MKDLKGFTLIELMIVVAIIGILAAIAIPAYQGAVCKQDLVKCEVKMPDAYARYLQSQDPKHVIKETVLTSEEQIIELTKMVAELANATADPSNKTITTVTINDGEPITTIHDNTGKLAESAVPQNVAKQYLFKKNDENALTLKRHTITGALYACPVDGECIKVNE